jgi:RNA polymerase sigma-70 factor (ECF subfamily)
MKDEELMTAYQAGHEEAFTRLYQRYSGKGYGFLSSRLQDPALVDDAYQATFLKLHQTRAKYDPTMPFAPWLFTVCRSAMIDTLRAKNRVQSKEDLDEAAVDEAVAPEAQEIAAIPELAVLAPNQRTALELRYIQDLSFEEISRRLQTTPENTRQLISRAVRKLRKLVPGGEKG